MVVDVTSNSKAKQSDNGSLSASERIIGVGDDDWYTADGKDQILTVTVRHDNQH